MPNIVLTQAQILALHTTLKARFNAGLKLSTEDWKKIAKLVTSDGKSNTYAWLSQFPAFREWVGARLHKTAAETAYSVVNRKFEATMDVQRTDIEDDNFGQYGDIAEGQGQAATDLMNDLIYQSVPAGLSGVCYDGQYFFDTDHPVAANEDGSGAITPFSNIQAGAGPLWVLLCTKRAPQPFYLQQRVAPQFEAVTSTQNANVFDLDVYSYGGRWRGNAVYGFWQLAYGSKATLNADNFNANYTAMMNMRADGMRRLGIVADKLVCGPSNMAAAEVLLKAVQNANGATNTNYNKVELVVTPWMD